jgi:hypothetical protein
MNQIFQTNPSNQPNCQYCGTPMRLFGIERDAHAVEMLLRSYECPHCNSLHTESEPALQSSDCRNPIFHMGDRGAFDDASLAVLATAFDAAWRLVETSGSPLYQDSKMAREQLARRVIAPRYGWRARSPAPRRVRSGIARGV